MAADLTLRDLRRRVVLAYLTQPGPVKPVLDHLRLPSTGSPLAPVRFMAGPAEATWQDDLLPDRRRLQRPHSGKGQRRRPSWLPALATTPWFRRHGFDAMALARAGLPITLSLAWADRRSPRRAATRRYRSSGPPLDPLAEGSPFTPVGPQPHLDWDAPWAGTCFAIRRG